MRYRWITIPTLTLGMLALAVNEGLAQRGGPPGSSGSRGSYSPEEVWARYGGGSGDTIDLNKNPQSAMMMKMKGYTIPPDGIVRKSEFLPQVAARIQAMSGGGGGPPGMGGPPPTVSGGGDKPTVILVPGAESPPPGSPPPGSDRDRSSKDRDRDRGSSSGWGSGDRGRDESRKVEEPEDERPNVLRYGRTPKELPGWFTELDTDKDAQIGLYEWRTAAKSIEDFLEKDLNGDGFLTVDEVLKNPKSGSSDSKSGGSSINTYGSKSSSSSSSSKDDRNSSSSKSKSDKDKSDKDRSDSKSSKDEKKSEPSNGSNPFLKK